MYWYIQPLEPISSRSKVLNIAQPAQVKLSWPATSQAAIGSVDQGVLAYKPNQTPRPTASTAKLITALTVLKTKPLKVGEKGPQILITQNDVDIYNQYFAKNGSVAKVEVGQKLSQYQMLQGTLLPSANNYADTLAIWAFGSLEKYRQAASEVINDLGMKHTTVGSDASGFSPSTLSTTEDLTKLAVASMNNELIPHIVRQDHVNLPVAGVKQNTNWLLGADGIIGLKTGHTDEAGGVYVFASVYKPDALHSTTIVGAIQGEPTIYQAMHQARLLIHQARSFFTVKKIISKDQVISSYTSPWGSTVNGVASKDIEKLVWKASAIKPKVTLDNIHAPAKKGAEAGTVKVGDQEAKIILKDSLDLPNWQWRVLRGL